MAVYKWKSGARLVGDPQMVGEQLARIEKRGALTPKAVVDASRRSNAPLHDYFEWRDDVAADKYREVQAKEIIRSVELVIEGSEPTRAFVSVTLEGGERSYVNVEAALSVQQTRDEVLATALSELRAFERKYSTLAELAEVIEAIRRVA